MPLDYTEFFEMMRFDFIPFMVCGMIFSEINSKRKNGFRIGAFALRD